MSELPQAHLGSYRSKLNKTLGEEPGEEDREVVLQLLTGTRVNRSSSHIKRDAKGANVDS